MSLRCSARRLRARPSYRLCGQELRRRQLAAVTASPGPLRRCIAGAGSGRTNIDYRVAYLLGTAGLIRAIFCSPSPLRTRPPRQMLDRGQPMAADWTRGGLWGGAFHSIQRNRTCCVVMAALSGCRVNTPGIWTARSKDLIQHGRPPAQGSIRRIRFPKATMLAEIFSFSINGTPWNVVGRGISVFFSRFARQDQRRARALRGKERRSD